MIINAIDRGIIPESDITQKLSELFSELKGEKDVTINLEKGIYYINALSADTEKLYITNTIAPDEWSGDRAAHEYKVAVNVNSIDGITINGNGAEFVITGKATNMVIQDCNGVAVNDLIISHDKPDVHGFRVKKTSAFYVDYELDANSDYVKENGKFYFIGPDFKRKFEHKKTTSWWNVRQSADDDKNFIRANHPFATAIHIKEIGVRAFRVYYPIAPKYKENDVFYLFNTVRDNVGIFVNRCSDVKLDGVKQHFNYSLAVVAQDTRNLTIVNCRFAPKDDSTVDFTSGADFIQACMCSGLIDIENNYFSGAGDDTLNVHGFHYKIESVDGNKIIVKYKHPQSFGFNPLHENDSVEYIMKNDLLTYGKAKIIKSKMIDTHSIELIVDNVDGAKAGMFIEDTDRCPDLIFKNNYMDRIVTRGILVTTRGKVVIESNNFANTSMSSILFSDDADNWYESGRVTDVAVKKNVFGVCHGWNLLILPENKVYNGPVHKNIIIEDNEFNTIKGGGIKIKATDNVIIKNNKIARGIDGFVTATNATNIIIEQ